MRCKARYNPINAWPVSCICESLSPRKAKLHRCLNLVCLALLLLQCRSWGKFWLAPKFSGFAPAVNPSYTVRSGFLVGSVANADGAEALEFSIDGGEFQTALGLIPFKIPLPTSSATWRLDSRHKITLRLRYPNNGLSDAVTYAVRKGNNRDINGDGYPDLVVGADQYNAAQGRAYIFLSRLSLIHIYPPAGLRSHRR